MPKTLLALLLLALTATSGCAINFDIGPYDVGGPAGDLGGAPAVQCPPSLGGIAIVDLGDSCRIGVVYDGVLVDGEELTADVDAGIAAAATLVGFITRVRSGSVALDTAQILGGNGAPPAVTWRDLEIVLAIDGGTEHVQNQATVPNTTGISFNTAMSSADLSVVNAVLDAPTTSDLSGGISMEGTLSLDDVQVLSDSGALSFEASVGADISVGL
ncbi:MAG: hypothetical protein KDA24_13375 [Deltaproteobacteria bacterium]|nr:hypothetical protein [Deltaproteobacteria bacterium]